MRLIQYSIKVFKYNLNTNHYILSENCLGEYAYILSTAPIEPINLIKYYFRS